MGMAWNRHDYECLATIRGGTTARYDYDTIINSYLPHYWLGGREYWWDNYEFRDLDTRWPQQQVIGHSLPGILERVWRPPEARNV